MQVSLLNRAVTAILPHVPKPLVWRFSRRYIAGTSLDKAFETVADLNALGCAATVDVLGEDVQDSTLAEYYRDLYLRAMDDIAARRPDCNVSVKLTEMGLRVDEALCRRILRELAEAAEAQSGFLRIDMEDSSVTEVTLDIYRELRRDHDCVGAVLQSCLRRSADDVAREKLEFENVKLAVRSYK